MQVATFVVHAYPLSPGARLCNYQKLTAMLSTKEAAFGLPTVCRGSCTARSDHLLYVLAWSVELRGRSLGGLAMRVTLRRRVRVQT